MNDTIFHKILSREIPAQIVGENDGALAFMDVTPAVPGHVLVIPKHAQGASIYDTTPEAMAPVWRLVHTMAPVVARAMGADGFNLIMNNGEASGQRVFYPHVHIIPRYRDDGLRHWPKIERSTEDIAADAQKIRAALVSHA